MRRFPSISSLLFFLLFVVTCSSAAVLQVHPLTLNETGETGSIPISIDTVPGGLSGFVCQVSVDNVSVCKITNISFPQWASLSSADQVREGTYSLRAVDINGSINAGESNVQIAYIGITGITAGRTNLTVEPAKFDDKKGEPIDIPSNSAGIIVNGDTITDLSIPLQKGWNFISIPTDLKEGDNTALIFQNVPSNGHSILSYSSSSGWDIIGKQEILLPMNAYWIYTSANQTIPLQHVNGPASRTKKLDTGWNMFGISGIKPTTAERALHSLQDWTYLIGFNADQQRYQQAIIRSSNTSSAEEKTLYPGKGYWIYLPTPEVLQP